MASRAIQHVLAGFALLCAAASLWLGDAVPGRAESPPSPAQTPAMVSNYPIASDARLSGDAAQTRFILDLDKPIQHRAFIKTDPDQVVVDLPQVAFRLPAGVGAAGRGLIKGFRYGLVMPGGSRIVMDLAGPAKIAKSYVLDAANGQPPRLVVELVETDRASMERLPLRSAVAEANAEAVAPPATVPAAPKPADSRPVVVIDAGHGGPDNGTQSNGEMEKNIVLTFALALRDRLEKAGKYRVVMTRTDDTFIPLDERVKIARKEAASLFISIHADALPRREGDAQGASIYTLSDKASDAEAERLAEAENKADAIGGVTLSEEPIVADILIDLAQRETRTFSNRFAKTLMGEMKTKVRMHKHPLKSAGFRVLKAPDVPSVLVELGYVSNKSDLELLVSEAWRSKTVTTMAQAIDSFLGKRLATVGPAN
ncbi:N-acetylmuramoyl-L-alanine amidase [Bradyrhizobium lablabi]|uniref:N-acetylmuramoyl-L-alanine amidase n=1 Tax=Bradyrhizobium lablabi TaxID=722472 RepID=UPI001BA76767|nr:N-acetylmuramoyl-L-alanine amidase [Bradyrhizobium lablabi]MBR1122548.1 N-acetylmuramoyl-L-alanine amidase [Bradyrhizobium lablabi]